MVIEVTIAISVDSPMPDQRFDEGPTLQTPALETFYVGQFQLI